MALMQLGQHLQAAPAGAPLHPHPSDRSYDITGLLVPLIGPTAEVIPTLAWVMIIAPGALGLALGART